MAVMCVPLSAYDLWSIEDGPFDRPSYLNLKYYTLYLSFPLSLQILLILVLAEEFPIFYLSHPSCAGITIVFFCYKYNLLWGDCDW